MEAFIYTTSDNYLKIFENSNTKNLITNIDGNIENIEIDGQNFVCFANKSNRNSYICSLSSAYIYYAMDELKLIENKLLRFTLKAFLNFAKPLFYVAKVENTIFLNNILFSTTFFPKNFNFNGTQPHKKLLDKYPQKLLAIRNINAQNQELCQSLENSGWVLMPARVVYMYYFKDLQIRHKKNNYKKDMLLLKKTNLVLQEDSFSYNDFAQMQILFEKIYIKKHSKENPQYTAEFISRCFGNKLFDICAFKIDDEIVAFIAIFEMYGVLSVPMLGYDTDLPQEMGLYRILCAKLHQIANEKQIDINFSSGAGDFKTARGGMPTKEYTAIYFKHLSVIKKTILYAITKFMKINEEKIFSTIDKNIKINK